MSNAYRDENSVPTLIASSNIDGKTPVRVYADPVTHRLLVDLPAGSGVTSINSDTTSAQTLAVGTSGTDFAIADNGSGTHTFNLPTASHTNRGALSSADWDTFNAKGTGTVTTLSVVSANGFAGSVANATTTPAITLTTTITGILKGNGTAISAASSGTDYVVPAGNVATATALATARAIYGNNFDGTAALTQIIASTYGGTGNGFTKFSGPTTAEKTFTLPDASATILTSNTLVTVAQGGSGSGTLTGILKGNGTSAFTAVTAPSGTIVGDTDTQTLTNKRITPRVLSAASYTTDTGSSINGDTQDMFIVTAQTGALKFNNPSGTPTDGQKLIISVASSTTSARALTWDTAYGSTTVTLPTTTAATTVTLTIGFIWSASKSLWQCVAVA